MKDDEYILLGRQVGKTWSNDIMNMKPGNSGIVHCPYIPMQLSHEQMEELKRKERANCKYATVKRSNQNSQYRCKTGKIVDECNNRYCLSIDTINAVSRNGMRTLVAVMKNAYENVWFNADELEEFEEYDENGDLKK